MKERQHRIYKHIFSFGTHKKKTHIWQTKARLLLQPDMNMIHRVTRGVWSLSISCNYSRKDNRKICHICYMTCKCTLAKKKKKNVTHNTTIKFIFSNLSFLFTSAEHFLVFCIKDQHWLFPSVRVDMKGTNDRSLQWVVFILWRAEGILQLMHEKGKKKKSTTEWPWFALWEPLCL